MLKVLFKELFFLFFTASKEKMPAPCKQGQASSKEQHINAKYVYIASKKKY